MALVDLLARLERRTDTPDTPCNPGGVSAEPAPILACTLDTHDTPQNINSESETPEPDGHAIVTAGIQYRQALAAHDDRRTCYQCSNLQGRRCLSAWRGEIVANRDYEPVRGIPRRCEGYAPGADDAGKVYTRAAR